MLTDHQLIVALEAAVADLEARVAALETALNPPNVPPDQNQG